eukprot:TRINITY_DN4834_c0_g4_i3.p1 TRINITY_DN4834_c0_g4~~TRINITY_DN4834_c0_g4_i3.p1  ORF type:complete len:348 (+),score=134.85 TRINITY_DN4834_c0_g4_i3:134-1177(+)
MHPMTPGRYPLLTGAVVVAAALLLLQQAVCCWYGTVSIALCLAWLLHSVGSSIGRGYTKELWRERRERLVYHTSKRVEALPFRQREQGIVLSVVAPCFNEAERIGRMLEETADYLKPRGSAWELIVVDDGSTDDSIEVALAAAKSLGIDDNVKVVPIKPNHGKGYVVKQGVFASSGDYILMADADAATDITELGSLEKYLKDHESEGMGVVIGSRAHMEEESKATRSPFRLLLMHIFHFCVAFTFAFSYKHTELQDTQCGFKLFSRKAALATFSNLHLERWSFDVELLVVAAMLGIGVGEVQVKWEEIEGSKVTVKSMVRMGMELLLTCFCLRFGVWRVDQNIDTTD